MDDIFEDGDSPTSTPQPTVLAEPQEVATTRAIHEKLVKRAFEAALRSMPEAVTLED